MCISFFKRCYYFPLFILIIVIAYTLLFFGYLSFDNSLITSFFGVLEKYDLNTIIIGIITIILAILTLCIELRNRRKERIENQIMLIDSLLAELETISADYSEVYGGEPTQGNLQWYKEQILSKNEQSLDHDINPISYDSYITKLDKNILTKIEFKKLVRTLSYINDKVREINYHTKRLNEIKLEELKKELKEVSINDPDKFKEVLKKTIEYGYFDEIKYLIKPLLEEEIKKKKSKIFIKGFVDLAFLGIRVSVLKNKTVNIEKTENQKDFRKGTLAIIDEVITKVGALKKLLEKQEIILHKV